ncbi:MAG: DUF92 domain-containing protein [Pyrobaculum sp.]
MEPSFLAVPSIVLLALLALRRGYLTQRGTISAIVVGSVVAVAHTGLFVLLAIFFLASSLLTRVRAEWKKSLGLKDVGGRSLRQVAGVGGPVAIFAALYMATGRVEFLGAAVVAIAVATADTWASEVGVAYGGAPRYILAPWRKVEPGLSGGVTLAGTAASLAGAFFIAVLAWVIHAPVSPWKIFLFGYIGELLDSVLGALAQRKYICGSFMSETPRAGCVERGFLNNESVNFLSGITVGLLSIL